MAVTRKLAINRGISQRHESRKQTKKKNRKSLLGSAAAAICCQSDSPSGTFSPMIHPSPSRDIHDTLDVHVYGDLIFKMVVLCLPGCSRN